MRVTRKPSVIVSKTAQFSSFFLNFSVRVFGATFALRRKRIALMLAQFSQLGVCVMSHRSITFFGACFASIVLASTIASPAEGQELTPNSAYFSVVNFNTPDANGNIVPYSARGFYEPGSAEVTPRLYLLPTVTVPLNAAKFFDAEMNAVNPNVEPKAPIDSIALTIAYSDTMPNAIQMVGIGATLSGMSIASFVPEPARAMGGQPLIYPPALANMQVKMLIDTAYQQIDSLLARQREIATKWNTYSPQSVPLNDLKITLLVSGQEVTSRQFSGSVVGMPQLHVLKPSRAVVNAIKNGNYEVSLAYHFTDTKLRLIEATIDAGQINRRIVEEAQRAVTTNKSMGFGILGLKFRRERIRQSFTETVDSKTIAQQWAKTKIVMTDATDDMVREFDDAFFPQISRQQAIDNHIKAAEATSDAGLKKAHMDYAKALQEENKIKEMDAVAAAAALASGNYALFVANGVRAQLDNSGTTTEFRRSITSDVEIREVKSWIQARRFSVQREMQVIVRPPESVPSRALLGILNAASLNYVVPTVQYSPMGQPFLQPTMKTGILVTCTSQDGAIHQAGIVPGMIIDSIDGHPVTTPLEFDEALKSITPGEPIIMRILDGTTEKVGGAYRNVRVVPRGAQVATRP